MKRFGLTAFIICLTFFPSGCGVHVGNGMSRYTSPYGFSFIYSDKLTLTEASGGSSVSLDNRGLAGHDHRSSISLTVQAPRADVTNATQLLAHARRGSVHEHYQTQNVPGAVAVVHRVETVGQRLFARYYFLLNGSRRIIQGVVSAQAAGDGMSLIAPVLDSFRGER